MSLCTGCVLSRGLFALWCASCVAAVAAGGATALAFGDEATGGSPVFPQETWQERLPEACGVDAASLETIATALGGEAWVEDRPGGGARFVVRLPTEAA